MTQKKSMLKSGIPDMISEKNEFIGYRSSNNSGKRASGLIPVIPPTIIKLYSASLSIAG